MKVSNEITIKERFRRGIERRVEKLTKLSLVEIMREIVKTENDINFYKEKIKYARGRITDVRLSDNYAYYSEKHKKMERKSLEREKQKKGEYIPIYESHIRCLERYMLKIGEILDNKYF